MNPLLVDLIDNEAGAAFSADTHRFVVASAGRRSGKTIRGKKKTYKRAVFNRPRHIWTPRYAMCAPTRGQAKAIFWQDLKDMTKDIHAAKPVETELFVTVHANTGSGVAEIHVVGLDEPARIEGPPWDGFEIDEVDDMPAGFWDEHLRPCLSDRSGWAILHGVPNGYGIIYDFSLLPAKDPDWRFLSWKSSEVMDPKEIASAMRTMDPKTFRQEYEASFEASSGRVFYAFDRKLDCHEIPDAVMNGPVMAGMDFNVDPMTSIIFADVGDITYILDVIEIPGSNTAEMCGEIRARYGQRCTDVYPDPSGRARKTSSHVGVTDHTIIKAAGFTVHTRLTVSIRDGINAVNSRFCTADGKRHCVVNSKCGRAIELLERHKYKKDSSVPLDDEFGHGCSAFRYAMDIRHSLIERPSWSQ